MAEARWTRIGARKKNKQTWWNHPRFKWNHPRHATDTPLTRLLDLGFGWIWRLPQVSSPKHLGDFGISFQTGLQDHGLEVIKSLFPGHVFQTTAAAVVFLIHHPPDRMTEKNYVGYHVGGYVHIWRFPKRVVPPNNLFKWDVP